MTRRTMTTLASRTARAVCAAGVGTALLLGAAPKAEAHYVPASTWDRLAQCESGGRWHLETGNGFHGGLQFTTATWIAYGGGRYAHDANHTSKQNQIRVAHGQGWAAWPVCSRRIGLR